MHPNYVVENYNFFGENNRISFSYRNEISLNYTLNDILLVLNVLNVIPLFNSLLRYISYNSDIADRVCRIHGFKKGLMFGLKSLFRKKPISLLLSIFLALMGVFAIVLRICEFQASSAGLKEDFIYYINTFWFVGVTMTTVGYGDYTP